MDAMIPENMESFFDIRAENYDSHMLEELDLVPFYDHIENSISVSLRHAPASPIRVLDLGCGTGLELERLFRCFPHAEVTGYDLSAGMLDNLQKRLAGRLAQLNLRQESYMDRDFGRGAYDLVLSTYSLHHFPPAQKRCLYRSVARALAGGGCFINGDYTVPTQALEREFQADKERIYAEKGLKDTDFYHLDTPLAVETEKTLLEQAGFRRVEINALREDASVFIAFTDDNKEKGSTT